MARISSKVVTCAIVLALVVSKGSTASSRQKRTTSGGNTASVPENQDNNRWFKNGVNLIKHNLKRTPITHTAKSAILFVGDGMSVTTVTAARILQGQMRNPRESGEENVLSWEHFPWTALSKTYNVDQQVSDSAGTSTAFVEGVKTNAGVIGVDETVRRGYCQTMNENNKVISILTLAEKAGMSTGFISTARATHATPAALYAHSPDRSWESDKDLKDRAKDDYSTCTDIATQLVNYPYGDGIEVILAGGRREFMSNNTRDPEYANKTGDRQDGRDLTQEWVNKHSNSTYVWNKEEFDKIDPEKVDKVLGLFEPSHMQYEVDRIVESKEPSIAEMTEKAIKILKKNPKGYFLMVEGGRIDHGHHAGQAVRALRDALAMADGCETAMNMTNREDTLLIVTADHSHVFTMAGYPVRGNPIFGLAVGQGSSEPSKAKDGMPYTVLGYGNGPGGEKLYINGSRRNLTGVDTEDKNHRQQAAVWLSSETHAGDDVGIYADGPGAYLFHGVVEQQYIFHVMDHALCLSESKQGSCDKHVTRGGPNTTTGSPDTTPGSPTKISVAGQNKAAVAIIGFLALLQYVF
ncbi:PREDICTED: alkaline phosphatase-like [Acropora digitifera]|uniref:alkaline phosphatase-like n=1 Tax=Acropora digitifera TaxID=70779 RepID=UPI000779F6E8|nr:PREDICTED: alkaline phosphatase-like [Acropora digitifera]XP_015749105.1 PREDICTED: alkaline phosphatase-like [Acropora digitifera]XP_015749106.1 PREDICTED: alkaline phosphatase-like [Acropora digitifera]